MTLSSTQQILLPLCLDDWLANPLHSPLAEAYPELAPLWEHLANDPSINGVLHDQLEEALQREVELGERLASANELLVKKGLDPQ